MRNKAETKHLHTATGQKLRSLQYEDNALSEQTDYCGAFVYRNSELSFIQTEGGRLVPAGSDSHSAAPAFEYHLTDHLGNIRVTFTEGDNGEAKIIQEDHYYPFGMRMSGQHFTNTDLLNKFLYNGKELQDQTGYYDYGFRQMDPALGRWHVPDALAEWAFSNSPYAYVKNDPLNRIDVLGLADSYVIPGGAGPAIPPAPDDPFDIANWDPYGYGSADISWPGMGGGGPNMNWRMRGAAGGSGGYQNIFFTGNANSSQFQTAFSIMAQTYPGQVVINTIENSIVDVYFLYVDFTEMPEHPNITPLTGGVTLFEQNQEKFLDIDEFIEDYLLEGIDFSESFEREHIIIPVYLNSHVNAKADGYNKAMLDFSETIFHELAAHVYLFIENDYTHVDVAVAHFAYYLLRSGEYQGMPGDSKKPLHERSAGKNPKSAYSIFIRELYRVVQNLSH